jgi:hypothetical protein
MLTLVCTLVLQSSGATSAKSLDFWIGDWECVGRSRGADGKTWTTTRATNHIERILGGKVIHENFQMGEYRGESWSVYSPTLDRWHQTWVDNQGSYIDLVGGAEQGRVTLKTMPKSRRPKAFNRMVFSKVTPSSFTWSWEASTDGGKTWRLQWELGYTRKPAS